MRDELQDRAVILGEYILDTGATVRAAAKVFKISKSTVHKDVTGRLYHQNRDLYEKVKVVLEKNKQERHIRGGLATKEKYLTQASKNSQSSKKEPRLQSGQSSSSMRQSVTR